MIKWLKRKLRNWLLEEEEKTKPISRTLSVEIDGKIQPVQVMHVVGLFLQCSIPHSGGSRHQLIREQQAVDKEHFKKLWSKLGGSDLKWEDGKPIC